jgi:hypothetical protein
MTSGACELSNAAISLRVGSNFVKGGCDESSTGVLIGFSHALGTLYEPRENV